MLQKMTNTINNHITKLLEIALHKKRKEERKSFQTVKILKKKNSVLKALQNKLYEELFIKNLFLKKGKIKKMPT